MTDNAKELLALARELRWPDISGPDDNPISVKLRIRAAEMLERLSARQQALVEEIDQLLMGACSVNMTYGACERQAERSRVALLAKYDIFEKVEG